MKEEASLVYELKSFHVKVRYFKLEFLKIWTICTGLSEINDSVNNVYMIDVYIFVACDNLK